LVRLFPYVRKQTHKIHDAGCSATPPVSGSPTPSAARGSAPTDPQAALPVSIRGDLPWTDPGTGPAPSLSGIGIASRRYMIVNDPDHQGLAFGGCADDLLSLLVGFIDPNSATLRLLTLAS
jgi:hypothetical protein